MDATKSIFMREALRRFNDAVLSGKSKDEVDLVAIEDDVIRDQEIIPDSMRRAIVSALTETAKKRKEAEQKLCDDLSLVWGEAFDALDQCIAFSDFLSSRFLKTVATGVEVLRAKDPRTRHGSDEVTGAALKCILLISLHARSSCTASEISCLLRRGFPSGAGSRLRTIHEQVIVATLLNNDHTYELAERYQDHAVFDVLQQLRAFKRVYTEPIWKESPGRDEMIAQQLRDAERDAGEARLRWGHAISEHYEWARPALANVANRKGSVTFAHLEKAAGADFLRGDYLTQNEDVHAGASATINHLMQGKLNTNRLRDDDSVYIAGWRLAAMLEYISQTVSKSVSWETEEYDELLYACEMSRTADITKRRFDECYAHISDAR